MVASLVLMLPTSNPFPNFPIALVSQGYFSVCYVVFFLCLLSSGFCCRNCGDLVLVCPFLARDSHPSARCQPAEEEPLSLPCWLPNIGNGVESSVPVLS